MMKWLKKHKRPEGARKCSRCKDTGLRWGWWTILVTYPLSILYDLVIWLFFIAAAIFFFIAALNWDSISFQSIMYAAATITLIVIGSILIWLVPLWMFPKCFDCTGKGYKEGEREEDS